MANTTFDFLATPMAHSKSVGATELGTSCIVRSAKRRYSSYSEAILKFFAPHGQNVAPMQVKFGTGEWTKGPLFHAKFHFHRYNDRDT